MFGLQNLLGFKLICNLFSGESPDCGSSSNSSSLFSSRIPSLDPGSSKSERANNHQFQSDISKPQVKKTAGKTSLINPNGSFIKKALLFLSTIGAAAAKETNVNVFFIGDIYKVAPDKKGIGGYAEGRTMLNQAIARSDNALIFGLGDLIAPYAFGVDELGSSYAKLVDDFFSYSDPTASHPALRNPYPYTVVGEGNHEYDYSRRVLDRVESQSHYQWLRGANVIDNQDQPISTQRSMIFPFDDINVGVFALVDEETEKNSWPNKFFSDEPPICKDFSLAPEQSVYLSCEEDHVRFDSIIARAKEMVKELKEKKADVIIALVHTKRDAVEKLMKEVPEIHLSLQGHDHAPRIDEESHIYNPGSDFKNLGEIALKISKQENSETTVLQSGRLTPNQGYAADPIIATQVEKIKKKKAAFDSIRIAKMDVRFSTDSTELRSGETLAGNLIADALRKRMEADCSIVVAGSIRGPIELQQGDYFTEGDSLEVFPYGDQGTLVQISGETLLTALENGVSAGWYAGKFLQVSGISFSYSLTKAPGNRIDPKEVFIQGEPLDLQKDYRVAAPDYMTIKAQDGYEDLARNSKILFGVDQHSLPMDRILADYMRDMDQVYVEIEGRITCKN